MGFCEDKFVNSVGKCEFGSFPDSNSSANAGHLTRKHSFSHTSTRVRANVNNETILPDRQRIITQEFFKENWEESVESIIMFELGLSSV